MSSFKQSLSHSSSRSFRASTFLANGTLLIQGQGTTSMARISSIQE
jgi:hypothetical protein